MEKEEICLCQAFSWQCPACGRENFERAIAAECSKEDEDKITRQVFAIGEHADIPKDFGVELLMAPDTVHCKLCQRDYNVMQDEDPNTEEQE